MHSLQSMLCQKRNLTHGHASNCHAGSTSPAHVQMQVPWSLSAWCAQVQQRIHYELQAAARPMSESAYLWIEKSKSFYIPHT